MSRGKAPLEEGHAFSVTGGPGLALEAEPFLPLPQAKRSSGPAAGEPILKSCRRHDAPQAAFLTRRSVFSL
jgi:hypothetical protein